MAIQITVSCLDGKSFSIVVDQEQVTLGRSSRMDVRLPFTTISGHHISLHRRGSGWDVEDVGSTNGTTMNGSPLTRHQSVAIARTAVLEVINVRIELEIVHIVEGFTLADSGTLARRMASDQLAELESDRARFTMLTGAQKNQSIFLPDVAETFEIGGGTSNGIEWNSYHVPDFLFSVSRHGEGFAIVRATNGLTLNGSSPDCPQVVRSDDEIRFEDVTLRFEDPLESYFVALDMGKLPGVEHEMLSPVDGTPSIVADENPQKNPQSRTNTTDVVDQQEKKKRLPVLELGLLAISMVLVVAGVLAIMIVLGILDF